MAISAVARRGLRSPGVEWTEIRDGALRHILLRQMVGCLESYRDRTEKQMRVSRSPYSLGQQ